MNNLYSTLAVLQWGAAMIIIFEAINKSHQCAILRSDITFMHRLSLIFKALAWVCIAMAAGGVIVAPVLREVSMPGISTMWINPTPSVSECGIFISVAVLILRSWAIAVAKEAQKAAIFQKASERSTLSRETQPLQASHE